MSEPLVHCTEQIRYSVVGKNKMKQMKIFLKQKYKKLLSITLLIMMILRARLMINSVEKKDNIQEGCY